MQRLILAGISLVAIGVAFVFSGAVGLNKGELKTAFALEDRNPVTHLRWNDSAENFQFAVVSDRTGGHRAGIFAKAVEKLNLMQPAFVLSVGDLIEGGKKTDKQLTAEWKEFDGFVNKLTMPFFYVSGNHDVQAKEAAKVWESKLGRKHYHFVYRNVLFLILDSDDPVGGVGSIGKVQHEYVRKTLADNAGVRWTIVSVHRPLWAVGNGAKNGWIQVEDTLKGRPYTVFAGHLHRYKKYVRNGMNYYQLATTGGSSAVRGPEFAEVDHFTWVTMKPDGPVLANILIDSVHSENFQQTKTIESGVATAKRLKTYPVNGQAFFEGVPMVGATITFTSDKGPAKGANAIGKVEADGSFLLTTYKAFDGAPAGEYQVAFSWPASGLPTKYATAAKSGLSAIVRSEPTDVVLELKK
ncbi:MAG: metallophosphoesterase [Gemmataceae bacterium]|nr:metallophosphoesterase [Gemmataceae bacterium]